jgi:uncharacterized protein (TIGR02996 family)
MEFGDMAMHGPLYDEVHLVVGRDACLNGVPMLLSSALLRRVRVEVDRTAHVAIAAVFERAHNPDVFEVLRRVSGRSETPACLEFRCGLGRRHLVLGNVAGVGEWRLLLTLPVLVPKRPALIGDAFEESMLRAIIEHPGDQANRLVYSDWLEQRNEQERAVFLRWIASGIGMVNGDRWWQFFELWKDLRDRDPHWVDVVSQTELIDLKV